MTEREAPSGTFAHTEGGAQGAVLAIIAVGAIVRFLLAATVGLGVDESYAVAISRQFSLSYFDHPPLHFWIASAIAKLAHSERAVVVRFPFVLCFAGTTWLTFRLATRLFSERAGFFAALLINVSAVFSLSTGGWVLPDGPLMLFMLAAANVLADVLFSDSAQTDNRRPTAAHSSLPLWSLAGLFTGLAMLSKYHGVFVLAGTFAFLVTSKPHRRWLGTPGPYVGALIAFACFTPVILWNAQHQWASFAFQGQRAAPDASVHIVTMLTNIGGQMAWVLPWIFVPLAASAWRSLRSGPRDAGRWFLLCLGAGPIVVFTLVSLRGDVGLPHWEAPGWLFLFPALGAAVADRMSRGVGGTRRWLLASTYGYVALIAILGTHAATGWMARVIPAAFEKGDPTGDLVEWRTLSAELKARGLYPVADYVAATSWIQAGKAAVALDPTSPVVCLCNDPHHFQFIHPDSTLIGTDMTIVHKERAGDDVLQRFGANFESLAAVERFGVYRHGQMVMLLEVFRGHGYRGLHPGGHPQ